MSLLDAGIECTYTHMYTPFLLDGHFASQSCAPDPLWIAESGLPASLTILYYISGSTVAISDDIIYLDGPLPLQLSGLIIVDKASKLLRT